MGILTAILIGLLVGLVAKLLMPGKDPGGAIVTVLIGMAGALVASLLGRATGIYRPGQTPGIIASIIGAMALLFVYRVIVRRRHHRHI